MQGSIKKNKEKKALKKVQGIIEITRRGVGYLPCSAEASQGRPFEDVEIANENLCGALNGDEVEVEIVGMSRKASPRDSKSRNQNILTVPLRPHGKVIKIIKRAREDFVCTLKTVEGQLVAIADDARFYRSIRLQASGVRRQEMPQNEKVIVRLIAFDGKEDPLGEIISVLGTAGEHRTEMHAIVLEHGFSTTFPADVIREAKEIEKSHAATIKSEAKNREDFRNVTTFTIDPLSAKDFDDALSVRALNDNTYEIGVHIADVSFFVQERSALDEEAQKRGTSVYLVDATIPMLPEELSGNVCSLKPGEDRLAFSAIFTINKKAEVLERRFVRTIIRSDKRFTYEEAQKNLDTDSGEFADELKILRDLARILRKNREKAGAIDFGGNEVSFELDSDGKPIAIKRKERIETNLLIEEFMLLANREVATYIADHAKKVPESRLAFVYRIHDEPKEDRIEELATFVRAVGYDFASARRSSAGAEPASAKGRGEAKAASYSAHDIQKLLKDIEGTSEETLIRTATLRSMAKAIYSTKNIGHFGLAFKYYTHFTSPIRRYPDILAHRTLLQHIDNGPISRNEYVRLERMCLDASEQEAKAADAERESIKYKQVEFMQNKIGKEFDAIISGVVEWGLYVEEKETAAEGLVRISSLSDDYYNFAPKRYALIGERKHKKYALGDRLRVKLVAADLISRQLEFVLV